jgi:hypothetical protein
MQVRTQQIRIFGCIVSVDNHDGTVAMKDVAVLAGCMSIFCVQSMSQILEVVV